MTAPGMRETIAAFTEAFNDNDLDKVMTFFSDEAVYEPGDGTTRRGRTEIRAAFEPQFRGLYGAMRFDDVDLVIDVDNRKAAARWVCRHDLRKARGGGPVVSLRRLVTRLVVGERFGWQGVDVFHFDPDGRIVGKFSYGSFGTRPHIQAELA